MKMSKIDYERLREWVQQMRIAKEPIVFPGLPKPDIDSITQHIYDELNTEEKKDKDEINPI